MKSKSFRLGFALSTLFITLAAVPLQAQSVWNVTNGNWNTAASWLPASVPVSSNTLQVRFNATSGSYTSTNNIGAMTLNRLTVNNTGTNTITLAGTLANAFTFAGTDPTLDITGTMRFTGFMAGSATITKIGSGTFIHDSDNAGFTGTIIINEGRFSNWGGTSSTALTNNFNPVSIVVNNGGVYQFGNAGAGDPNLPNTTYITLNEGGQVSWQESQTLGGIHLLGGNLDLNAGNITPSGATALNWTHGTLTGNANSGAAYAVNGTSAINKTTTGTVTLSGATSITTSGGINLMEGRIIMNHAVNLGSSPLTFGSTGTTGTLEYRGATASRGGNLVRAADGTGVIEVTQATTILTLSGANSGAGLLQKTGAGTLHLTGTLGATGDTQVSAGTLRVNPVSSTGGFIVDTGAILAVNMGSATTTFDVPMLILEDNATLNLELNRSTLPNQTLVNVRSLFLMDNSFTLNVTNAQNFATGTYTLLDYTGFGIGSGIDLKLSGRTLGNLIYDELGTRIQLEITGTDSLKWTGATDGVWDVGTAANVGGTQNWQLMTGGTATNFIQTDNIRFDDTATRYAVQLNSSVAPTALTVTGATDYTFSGTGKITGTTSLAKTGTGILTLATDNDYMGGTSINGGGIILGNGGTTGSVVGSVALTSSIFGFNRSEDFTFENTLTLSGTNTLRQNGTGTATVNSALSFGSATLNFDGTGTWDQVGRITGTGIINKNGSGQLNLLGLSSFTGTLNINGGVVQLTDRGASGDLNAASIVVNNGTTFIFGPDGNPDLPSNTMITINTGGLYEIRTGESYGGIVLNGGEYRAVTSSNTGVNTGAEAGTAGRVVYDFRSGRATTAITGTGNGGILNQSGGGVLAKTTSGTVTLEAGVTMASSLDVQIKEGTLAMVSSAVPATGTAVVSGGANAAFTFGGTGTQGTLRIDGAGTPTTSRSIILTGNGGVVNVVETDTALTFTGAISGNAPLVKTGLGALNLQGALNSTALTTASAGTLRLKPGTAAGGFAAETGAVLAISNTATPATMILPSLTLADASTLQFEFASSTTPGVALMQVTGSNGFSFSGIPVFRLTNSQAFSNGLFTLLDYSGTAISSGLTLRFEGRTSGNLVYDTANTQIQVNITGTDSVKWTGSVNSVWDTGTDPSVGGTFNWQLINAGTATNFITKDIVRFDDTATNRSVQIPGTVSPLSVTVDASNDYTFTGVGKISGTAVLSKTGTGTLILATANDYTGGTTVSGGTLQLGNGGTGGSVTGAISLTDSTLAFNRSDTFTFNNALTLNGTNTIKQIGSGATMNFNSVLTLGTNTLNLDIDGVFNMSAGLDGTGIINKNGSGHLYLLGNHNFAGTLNINGGIVQLTDRGAAGDFDAVSIVVNNTGTFIFGPDNNPDLPSTTFITINAGGRFEIHTGESYGGFTLNGGVYHATAGSTGAAVNVGDVIFDLRSGEMTTTSAGAIGQGGGGWVAKTTSGTVTIQSGITFTSATPIRFQEGTLAMPVSSLPTAGSAIVTGGAIAGFDFGSATTQGTLQIQGAGSTSSSRPITLAAGGGRVDIVEAGTTLTFTGAISGNGPLVKAGAGELNLNGALNATGLTTAEAGVLRVLPGTAAGGFATQSGATLAVVNPGSSSFTTPSLSLAGGSTIRFELNSNTLPTTPFINITDSNGLTWNGAGQVVLRLNNTQPFSTGLYTLLDYAGTGITSGFALEIEGRSTGTLVYDTTGTTVSADITQGEIVVWKGTQNSTWDAGSAVNVGGTMNWQTLDTSATTNFIQADRVLFDDTPNSIVVNLVGELRPTDVMVEATSNYYFNGTGSITGSGRFEKASSGTLQLTGDHTYTGGTTISGGVMQLGNGGTTGSITGNIALSGGGLVIHRSDTYSLAGNIDISANSTPAIDAPGALRIIGSGDVNQTGIISGAATRAIQMDGTGTLYLKSGNTYTGLTIINSGTVSVASNTALGASTADVYINGGTLQLTASNFGTVSSTGRSVTVGPNGATFDFASNQNFQGNGFFGTGNVVKTGVGRWGVGSNASTFTGELLIAQGSLLMTSAQLNGAKKLTVADGAQFIIDDDTAGTWSLAGGKFYLNGDGGGEGALRQFTSSTTTANNTFTTTFDREFVLGSARTLISTESVNGTIHVTDIISGVGGLAKQGIGVLRLAGAGSTYTGGTVVESGTLWISNTAGSGTGSGTVLVKSGASLIGTGDISGDTTIHSGGRIQGGTAANRGNFGFLSGLILESGSLADFRLLGNNATDRLTAGTLTLETGSILRLYLGYTPEAGDTFNILDWTSLGSGNDSNWVDNIDFTNALLPDTLGWDTSLFNSQGVLSVVLLVPEPSRVLFMLIGCLGLIFRRRR